MNDIQKVRTEIVGKNAYCATPYLLAATVYRYVGWPVDAYTVDIGERRDVQGKPLVDKVYWLKGKALGAVTFQEGENDDSYLVTIYRANDVSKVALRMEWGDQDVMRVDRKADRPELLVQFSDQDSWTIRADHNDLTLRENANRFIDTVVQMFRSS